MIHLNSAFKKNTTLWKNNIGAWAPCLGQGGSLLVDRSNTHNHGTLTTLVPASSWGPVGGKTSLLFSGTSGQRVEIGRSVLAGMSVATIAAWFRATSISTDQAIYSEAYHADGSFLASLRITTSKAIAAFRDGTPGTTATVTGATTLLDNVTYHIAGVFTQTAQYVFVNGVQDGSSATAMGPLTSTWVSTRLGAQNTAGLRQFTGSIGEVMAYNNGSIATIKQLSSRRGIEYETIRNRNYKTSASFRPAWALQRTQMIGGGIR